MKKVLLTTVGALALGFAAAGYAGQADTNNTAANNDSGIYVGGNLGGGSIDYDLTVPGEKHNHFVWGLDAGYQFNQYIAAEIGYLDLPSVDVSGDTLKQDAIYVAAKAMYPIVDKVDVFGKFGFARRTLKVEDADGNIAISSDHKISPLVGIGAEYNITQNISANVQGTAIIKNTNAFPTVYMGTAGVAYKFAV